MNNRFLTYIFAALLLGVFASCSKSDDDDKEKGEKIEKGDLIGEWTASSGKFNMTLTITSSGYDFRISEPGNGGVIDNGMYDIEDDGAVYFTHESDGELLAIGYMYDGALTITFVEPIMISMLGTGAASHVEFTPSGRGGGGGDDGGDDEDGYGNLVVQNMSSSYDIVSLSFYDGTGELIATDTDVLEADFQVTYEEVPVGSYTVKAQDSRGRSYTSKSFKVIKNKAAVLQYTGSALNVYATGADIDDYRFSTRNSKNLMIQLQR